MKLKPASAARLRCRGVNSNAEERIEAGELVYMGFTPVGRVWWLNEPYEEIEPDVIRRMGNRLIEMGDCLFGWPGFSQTWHASRD